MMGPTYQPSTIAILKHLQEHGPLTVDEFGKLKHIGTTAPGVRVASMVKRGTVARVDMSRPARYAITKRGLEAVTAVANGLGNLVPRTWNCPRMTGHGLFANKRLAVWLTHALAMLPEFTR